MKLKNIRAKHLVALALALFMVVPMLFAGLPIVKAQTYPASGTPPYIDIVKTGGAASQSITNIPVQAIGTTFSVDVRVDNYAEVNIGGTNNGVSGASYIVTWNPAVLEFVSSTDNTWLPSQSNPGDLSNHVAQGQLTIGQIAFVTTNAFATADNSAGSVSTTIEFQVLSAGTSAIGLEPQVGVPYLVAPETIGGLTSGQPVPGTLTYTALYNPKTTISLLQSPSDSTNVVQFPSNENPISQTFQMDIYINNPLAVPIWGWNIGVTWNPAALQLTAITEGTYLSTTNLNNQQGATTLFVPGFVNNNAGDIPQGISDVYLSYTTQDAPAGVLATLTFTVINYADSHINLTQGIPTLDTLTGQTPTAVTPAPILNNATYITNPAPAPQSPVAVIANPSGVAYAYDGTIVTPYTAGTGTIEFTSIGSTGGIDPTPSPLNELFPITAYQWTVTQGASQLTLPTPTASSITFTPPSVTVSTTFTIQLVVSSASNPGDPSYNPNSAPVTITFTVQPQSFQSTNEGPLVDVYIVNPSAAAANATNPIVMPTGYNGNPLAEGPNPTQGTGTYTPNAPAGSFGPQQTMNLQALVTFNGAPVADKEVTFQVTSSETSMGTIATITALTNNEGLANTTYTLPWVNGGIANNNAEFGTWNVQASAEVNEQIVTDNMPFYFGDLVTIASTPTVAPTSLPRSTPTITSTATVTVHLLDFITGTTTTSPTPITVYVTYTVMDTANVPIATGEVTCTFATNPLAPASDSATISPTPGQTTATFAIPQWAFVGGATIQVNVFNTNPLTTGATPPGTTPPVNGQLGTATPYCPEQTGQFTITIPSSE